MGVCIHIRDSAMRRPTRVRYSRRPLGRGRFEVRGKIADPARFFSNVQIATVQERDARTVIAAILEAFEAFEQDWKSLL